MPIFIGPRGGFSGGGGSGGRQTVLLSGSPFTTLAALETFSQANPTELFNNSSQVALAVVTSDPTPSNNGTYEYAGPNLQYQANQWVLFSGLDAADIKNLYESNPDTNAFTNADDTLVTSARSLSANKIPMATGAGLLMDSAVTQDNDEVRSTMPIASPSAGAYRLGNLDIFNDGLSISIQDLATNRDFIPVAYERTNSGSERASREVYSAQATTPPAAASAETFSGAQHQFAVRNVGRGTAQSYTLVVPANAPQVTDCNITIRYNSHTDPVPVFDYKEATGGEGFTLVAGNGTSDTDSLITLPRAAWFPDGVDIYVTLSAGASQTLQLRGETLDLSSIGLGMQEVPRITVVGQETTEKELADLDDIEHPVTLRRDMPTLEDATRIVNASLNQNSALWVVANDQIPSSNRSDATIVAQVSGLPDINGDDIPTTPVVASTIQMRSGSIVRIFGANDYRVVSVPVREDDISSAIRTDEDIRDVVGATLVAGNNVTINENDTANTITISASVSGGTSPTTPQPSFERFEFQSQPTNVPAGTTLSGPLTFNLRVNRPDLLTGTLTLRQGNSVISSGTIQPTATSFTATVTSVTLAAGQSVSFTIEGTVTSGGTITSHITVRSPQTHEIAYWGIRSSNDFATTPLTDLNSVDVTTNSEFDVTGAFANDNFIGILVPPTHDVREITTFNLPVKDQFTRTANARTIGSQDYILYTLENNGGIDGTAAYTVEI